MSSKTITARPTRRAILAGAAGTAMTAAFRGDGPQRAQAQTMAPSVSSGAMRNGLNILFVFTDQQRYQASWPRGLSLPGQERLQARGVTFTNHYGPATMCTSSRAVMMTGLQTPDNGMFENCDVAWMRDLPASVPTIGHMLRKAGHYSAYKGKWHLSRDLNTETIDRMFTKRMDEFGFADNFSPGDVIGHTLGGYSFDHIITGSAINWLRTKGRPLTDEGKPWSMVVSLVNPHDVMYFNTDAEGEAVQDNGRLIMHANRAPKHELYQATWDVPVPANLRQPFDAPGRVPAHGEFDKVWDYVLGNIPTEEARWRRFNDYYLNCIRNVDQQVAALLRELDALRLTDRTIVIFTSDHGEMAGAHGLRGKGPFAYEETLHLPMHIVHPDVAGGQTCQTLTSHIDLVPSMLSMAGLKADRRGEVAGRDLPGKDITAALAAPGTRGVNELRDSVLFTYSGLITNDSSVFDFSARARAAGKDPMEEAKRQGYKPNLMKRGSVRTMFDGRHKLTRYFAPVQRNSPRTLDELYALNDVELFDRATDPAEMTNLAADRKANPELVMAMSNKLEAVIKAEIGVDNGREMPELPNVTWGVTKVDL